MKHTFRLAIAVLLGTILFGLTLASTSAMPSLQTGQQPRTPPGPHREVQFADPTDSMSTPIEIGPLATIPGWSRLVFQSYRDSNWEIYRANANGTGQTRVTTNPAAIDYSPRLNPGASRIALVSDRNGPDFDIFVVDWNGSGLTALTNNASDDVSPAWSPNGSQLAFETYRDGQAEVYRMNASGSTPTRLTNNGAYDGTPAWSPDNAKIAFDADADNDGFEELWLMNADGSGQRQIYDPPQSNQLVYARSWSADERHVAFTRLTYDGPVTTEAIIAAWDSFNPNSIVRLSPGNRDTNPDWRATPDPDLWVSQSSSAALPGEQVELLLVYGNRGTVAARNVRITEQLPARLTFVSADPPPDSTSPVLRWNKSTLSPSGSQSLIRITVRVNATTPLGTVLTTTAGITSGTSEPDMDNNTANANLVVRWLGYLPLVIK